MYLKRHGVVPLGRGQEIIDALELEVGAAYPNSWVILHRNHEGIEDKKREQV